jgi:hypothetical protein
MSTPSSLARSTSMARQIRQRHDVRLFQALVVQITELDLQLVEFRAKFFTPWPRRKCPSAGHDGHCPASDAVQIRHAGFLGGDAENGVLDDVNFRARLVQAFAQFGDRADFQALVIRPR